MENAVRRVDWIIERREWSGGGSVPSGGATSLVDAGCPGAVRGEGGETGWFSF